MIQKIAPNSLANEHKLVTGDHTTVAASDTIVTGLRKVLSCGVSMRDDPVDGAQHFTATPGNQAGTPAAGSILIKGWKATDGDATLVAADTFSKKVDWWAVGY